MRLHFGDLPQSQENKPKLEGWHRIRSPDSRLGYLLAGLIGFVFPNVLCAWLIIVSVFAELGESVETPMHLATPWGAVLLALLLFIPLHELFHALWHPQRGCSPQTVLVIWPSKLRFGVYYEGCMTRKRWLIMRITPLLFLSVVPVGLLTIFYWVPVPSALHVFLQVMMLVNGIGSGGDIVAVAWVLFQVPSGVQICFYEGKAYWRQVSPQSSPDSID
jgi:hypothetical protein